MKFRLTITTLFLSLFLVGSAFAVSYSVNFDPDGTGGVAAKEIWGFDTEGIVQYTLAGPLGGSGSTYIEQDLGDDGILGNNDRFKEKFTTLVYGGYDSNLNPFLPLYPQGTNDLKIDIALEGYISGYDKGVGGDTTRTDYANIANDSYFTNIDTGSAKMYLDANNNNIWDTGETVAATFGFLNSTPSFLSANVWPGGTGSALYSVGFSIDTYNDDDTFWTDASFGTSIADLVSSGFLLTFNDGSAKALGVDGDPNSPANTILLSFDDNGIDIVFDAVPEPATMLLFGIGLMGLAGVSRRKNQS